MKHQFIDFIDDLRSTHGGNLVSVVLYGSAAAGDFVQWRSDHNILIVLKRIGPEDLRKANAAVREWVRLGNPVPVYFTRSELTDAADVFPIEFSGMKAARNVLYGTDVLAGIEFTHENLRHQTEYELRSKLIGLRRSYIPASATVEALTHLMTESISNFVTLFGAVLMLRDVPLPATKREIVALTAKHAAINGAPFEKLFNIRENNFVDELDEMSANRLFGEYLEQIEKVIDAVNALDQ